MNKKECKECEYFKVEVVRDWNGNSLKTVENCWYKGKCVQGGKFLRKQKTINCNKCKHKLTVMGVLYKKDIIEKKI